MLRFRVFLFFFLGICIMTDIFAGENDSRGENAWLNYRYQSNDKLKGHYVSLLRRVYLVGSRYDEVIKTELEDAFSHILGIDPCYTNENQANLCLRFDKNEISLGEEGFCIVTKDNKIYIKAYADAGFLYAVYHLIRLMQCGQSLGNLNIRERPQISLRVLNHWDDMDGNVERGYAGKSLWKWNELPYQINNRYEMYARINASVGINGIVLNNVNADPRFLRKDYLLKVASLADIFRKYHIRLFLSVNFASPLKPSATPNKMKEWGGIGILDTADPNDIAVQIWWSEKVKEIYQLIPDFGGFLVKANSEGMPGPQDYHCTHAQGANMLARVLKPYGGWVFWRTFVYNPQIDSDRMKRSYKEFKGLDGQFDENVILQTKNGPLDFQIIEPPQPLFGAMKQTNMAAELQITQEYTGHSTYLVYLLPFWKWFLDFDTYCMGKHSSIKKILEGKIYPYSITAIAGVANTGDTLNWTGHHFAQANWFAYGKLAWNPSRTEREITDEWIRCTWSCKENVVAIIREMMLPTWRSFLQSVSPYGLGLTMDVKFHYKADFETRVHKEWEVCNKGIGYDRSSNGSNFVSQYFEPNRSIFNNIETCPEDLLLCFHFVKWDFFLKSGNIFKYDFFKKLKSGVEQVEKNITLWQSIVDEIDRKRFDEVLMALNQERKDANLFYKEAVSFFNQKINVN